MPAPNEIFRELTRVFDPIYRPDRGALDGPGSAYIAEAHEDFRRQLEASLELNDKAKLLVAGQPGCGKTTLLRSLVLWLRGQGRFAAFVDLEVQTAVQDLGLIELHLAAMAEILASVGEAGVAVPDDTLRMCAMWLDRVQSGDSDVELADPRVLSVGIRKVLGAARDDSEQRRALRTMVLTSIDGDPFQLLVKLLIDLKQYRPVVVFDGLDKLPPDQAREFFLDNERKSLTDAPGAAILTIPISVVYEPVFNVLSERYNNADSAVLPAVRLWEFDAKQRRKTPSKDGRDVLRKIVEARTAPIDKTVVMTDAVDRAIEGSGGNIRELARLMQASIVKAHVRRGDFVERQDVERAIADQRESFRRTCQPRFLPVLKLVRDEFRLENTDDIGKLLLYGLWVMECRNGETWYCLPVAVDQLVDQFARG